MKERIAITMFGIVFLLTVSITSASLLTYYSKTIGIAEVSEPTFYAYPESVEGYNLYKLGINEPSSASEEFSFTNGDFIGFTTDPLGITSFYPATYTFYVKARVEDPPRNLSLELWIRNIDGDLNQLICEAKVIVDSSGYKTYGSSCSADSLSLSESDSFYWKLYGLTTASVSYSIMVDGSMRVEVEALG